MFCDAYAIRGTCPQEAATHFSGHVHVYIIYISACTGMSNSMVHVSVGLASLAQLMYSVVNRLENFKYINGIHSGLIQNFLCYGMTGE